MRAGTRRGFTLLEVIVALSILAISLTVLLQSQATSLQFAGRSRDISVATLLARGKMVDIQQKLFHEGFVQNDQSSDGDFEKEGHPEIKWKARVSEIELDLTNLLGMCQNLSDKNAPKGDKGKKGGQASNDCGTLLSSVGSFGGLLSEIGRSMRAVELDVEWPVGRYTEHINLRQLLTRDDFQTLQEGDAARNAQKLEASGLPGGLPGGMTGVPVGQSVPGP
jgi:general secretion pathway protein I